MFSSQFIQQLEGRVCLSSSPTPAVWDDSPVDETLLVERASAAQTLSAPVVAFASAKKSSSKVPNVKGTYAGKAWFTSLGPTKKPFDYLDPKLSFVITSQQGKYLTATMTDFNPVDFFRPNAQFKGKFDGKKVRISHIERPSCNNLGGYTVCSETFNMKVSGSINGKVFKGRISFSSNSNIDISEISYSFSTKRISRR